MKKTKKNTIFLETTSLVSLRSKAAILLSAAFIVTGCETTSDLLGGVSSDGNSSYTETVRRAPTLNKRSRAPKMNKESYKPEKERVSVAEKKPSMDNPYDQYDQYGNEAPKEEKSEGNFFGDLFKASPTTLTTEAKPVRAAAERKAFPKNNALNVPMVSPVPPADESLAEPNVQRGQTDPLLSYIHQDVDTTAEVGSHPSAHVEPSFSPEPQDIVPAKPLLEASAEKSLMEKDTHPVVKEPVAIADKLEKDTHPVVKEPVAIADKSLDKSAASSRIKSNPSLAAGREVVRDMIQEVVDQAAMADDSVKAAQAEVGKQSSSDAGIIQEKPALEQFLATESMDKAAVPSRDTEDQFIISPKEDEKLLGRVGSDSGAKLSITVPNQNIDKPYPEISSVPQTPKAFGEIKKQKDDNLKDLQLDHEIAQKEKLALDREVGGQLVDESTSKPEVASEMPSFNEIVKTPIAKAPDSADGVSSATKLQSTEALSSSSALSRSEEFDVNIPESLNADDENLPSVSLPRVDSYLPSVSSLQEVNINATSQGVAPEEKADSEQNPTAGAVDSSSALPSLDKIKNVRPSRYEARHKQSGSY